MEKIISTQALETAPSTATLGRYLQLALLVLAAGAIYPMLYLRQVYQSSMIEALAISNSELGYLYSILGTAFLISYLPSGWLADRISPRFLISFSLIGTGLLGLWYAQLPSFTMLLAIFCGFGITTGLTFWASLIKRVNMIAGDTEHGRFFGVLDGGRGLVEALLASAALALFAYVADGSASANALGLVRVIHFYAACCIVLGLLLSLVRDPQVQTREKQREKPNVIKDLRTLAGIPELWLVTAIVFCGYHFFWATYSFSAYLQEGGFDLSATAAGLITTVKLWMRPLGGIGGGWLGDRFSKVGVLAWAMVLAALGMLGLILLPSLHVLGVLIFLVLFIGLMTYAIRGLYWAILDDCRIPLQVTGLAIGIISLVGYSPDVFLPLLNGWITDQYPGFVGYRIYFSYVVVIGLLGVVATFLLHKRIKAKADQA